MRYQYVVASEYSGEQGHLGGGDYREHFKADTPEEAFQWIKENDADLLMYRNPFVVVKRVKK